MTDTARDHLERAVAWLTDITGHEQRPAARRRAARAEVEHALELLDAIPPREPTEKMMYAGAQSIISGVRTRPGSWADEAGLAWRAMYDAAIAEKEVK